MAEPARKTARDLTRQPTIRLHDPNDGQPDLGELTLIEAFVEFVMPGVRRNASKSTLQQYRRAVELFANFDAGRPKDFPIWSDQGLPLPGVDTGCAHTGVAKINDQKLESFAEWMIASGFEASTFNKVWGRLRPIFRRLAPRGEGNPNGLGIIAEVPYVQSRRAARKRTKSLDLDTLDRLYRTAADMTWPDRYDVAPAAAWRALLVLLYNYGPRPWSDGALLPMDAVHLAADCPDEDNPVENEAGWLCYTPTKTKRYSRELLLPLNDVSRRHFEPLLSDDRELLFSFGRANKHFYREWGHLCELARVAKFDLRMIRKTSNTQYNRLRAGLGKWFLGHAPTGTNETFYQDIMPNLLDGVHKLPQPPAFVSLIGKPVERQGWLFE